MSEGEKKSPLFWFAVCGFVMLVLGYILKGMGREPLLALISSLSFGFFGGSMGYSVSSLAQSSGQNTKTNIATLITLSILLGLIGGAYYVVNGDLPKALEVGAIIAGIASLSIGHIIEERMKE